MYGGDLKYGQSLTVSGTLFQLLLRADHVDHKGVVGGVEAADGDAGGKEDGQDEVEV